MLRAPIAYALLAFAAPGLATSAAAAPVATTKDKASAGAPKVSGAWVRLNPVPGRPSAGYLTVVGGTQPDRLVSVSTPAARVEMHSMSMDGGIMRMGKLDAVVLPAGSTVAFAPGGNHLMVFGLAGAPKSLPLTLHFASGATVETAARVEAAGDAGH